MVKETCSVIHKVEHGRIDLNEGDSRDELNIRGKVFVQIFNSKSALKILQAKKVNCSLSIA